MGFISATSTRNFAYADTILDWLDLYAVHFGYIPDNKYPDYDPRLEFSDFITSQGKKFEAAVMNYFARNYQIETVCEDSHITEDRLLTTMTKMRHGVPIIYQAPLQNHLNKTQGIVDFLIRSDVINELYPGTLLDHETFISTEKFPDNPFHYRAVDVKFTTLDLLVDGSLQIKDSTWAYMMQMFIYNKALALTQGYEPPEGYLIGRKWKQRNIRGNNFTDKLIAIPNDSVRKDRGSLSENVQASLEWLHALEKDGKNWKITPDTSISLMRPNMKNTRDFPWHKAKSLINSEVKDLTTLWNVGVVKRNLANKKGIFTWDRTGYDYSDLGFNPTATATTLQKIIDINTNYRIDPISPSQITKSDQSWRKTDYLDFYVDFETVNDLDDDFSGFPESGGQPMIFMIGCGHIEDEKWNWKCFTVNLLNEESEAQIIDAWFDHMNQISQKFKIDDYRVFHWSPAETSNLETAFNSAENRHPFKSWPKIYWYDFLKKVVKAEPVVIKDSFGFGLKSIANSLHKLGAIDTLWGDGPTDGLGAMTGAWVAHHEAALKNISMNEIQLTKEIEKYNEVDCKVMWEIVKYFRENH